MIALPGYKRPDVENESLRASKIRAEDQSVWRASAEGKPNLLRKAIQELQRVQPFPGRPVDTAKGTLVKLAGFTFEAKVRVRVMRGCLVLTTEDS